MSTILRYEARHEAALIALLCAEPLWSDFTRADRIEAFKRALRQSDTYICQHGPDLCGYLRAWVDAFGVYVSELYVAPAHRSQGYGRAMLTYLRSAHREVPLYVLSDEDRYYERLGYRRVGSIFQA